MHRRAFLQISLTGTLLFSANCTSERTPAAPSALPPLDVEQFQRSRRFQSVPQGRIAYIERGSGPAALFLHGFPLNGFQWRGALERLAPYRRCIAPDFIGLGHSEAPADADVSPHAQARMLTAFLNALKLSEVDLIANDSGGAVAQIFVAQNPQRVRTLLLTNCDANQDSPPRSIHPLIELARAGRMADEEFARMQKDHALARTPERLGGAYTYPATLTDSLIDCYLTPIVQNSLRKHQANQYMALSEPNPLLAIEPALKQCPAPTRILWGTGDTIMDPASAAFLDHTFPHSRGVRRIQGAKLFFPEEMPDLIAEEARRLWLM